MRQIANGGKLIVVTAPLTETIDHADLFIQMGAASMPNRLEGIFNWKYPNWKEMEHKEDGSARYMPAGLRTLEAALLREYPPEESSREVSDTFTSWLPQGYTRLLPLQRVLKQSGPKGPDRGSLPALSLPIPLSWAGSLCQVVVLFRPKKPPRPSG